MRNHSYQQALTAHERATSVQAYGGGWGGFILYSGSLHLRFPPAGSVNEVLPFSRWRVLVGICALSIELTGGQFVRRIRTPFLKILSLNRRAGRVGLTESPRPSVSDLERPFSDRFFRHPLGDTPFYAHLVCTATVPLESQYITPLAISAAF